MWTFFFLFFFLLFIVEMIGTYLRRKLQINLISDIKSVVKWRKKGLEHAIKPTGWPSNSFKEAYSGGRGGGTVILFYPALRG